MRQIQTVIAAALLFLVLLGCAAPIDFGDPFPLNQPDDADLPGLYVPTHDTVNEVAKAGYAPQDTAIEIRANGTFHVRSIPDWWRTTGGKPAGGFESGSGNWRIVKEDSWWSLQLHFPSRKEFAQPEEHGETVLVRLIGQKPPYQISLHLGDWDGGRMFFKKV